MALFKTIPVPVPLRDIQPCFLPLLLNIKELDGVCVFKKKRACAGVENVLTVGGLDLLDDLILQVLDNNLYMEKKETIIFSDQIIFIDKRN